MFVHLQLTVKNGNFLEKTVTHAKSVQLEQNQGDAINSEHISYRHTVNPRLEVEL